MPLTPAQEAQAKSWLQSYGKPCHNCGGTALTLGEIICGNTFAGSALSLGGPSIPMLQVVCNSCAFIHLYAAVAIGLTK